MSNFKIINRSEPVPASIERQISKYFNKMKRINNKITICNLVIDTARKHTLKSRMYNVKVEVHTPGKQFISKKQNPYLLVAIRESFASTQSLLRKYLRKKIDYFNRRSVNCNKLPVDVRQPLSAA
ncbi:MAG TPA: hypothetical protein VHM20_02260 [Gammaproteobacteria bacterium]|jgi:ribosome-associated translation inhibitor RaiA|nr:hypothetical protein [Gammaproteobacteria bacterium]